MDDITQGTRANRNGRIGEETLEPTFIANGYQVMPYSEYKKNQKKFESGKSTVDLDTVPRLILKQVPYTTIYGQKGKTEFVIYKRDNPNNVRIIRVEVKWQQSAGSVDEKYPYVYLNSVYAYPEQEIVVIIDGNGYKPGALQWLKDKVDERWLIDPEDAERKIKVMNISEFIAFFNQELR